MSEALNTNMVISSVSAMCNQVIDDYNEHDEELSNLFFDFNVRMVKADIIRAYAILQKTINGDQIIRIENGQEQGTLIPEGEMDDIYEGNCREFLESFNGTGQFLRFDENEILGFIFV